MESKVTDDAEQRATQIAGSVTNIFSNYTRALFVSTYNALNMDLHFAERNEVTILLLSRARRMMMVLVMRENLKADMYRYRDGQKIALGGGIPLPGRLWRGRGSLRNLGKTF